MTTNEEAASAVARSEDLVKALAGGLSLSQEFYYSALPFCAVDAVFSIGVRYEGVRNTVVRVAASLGLEPYREQGSPTPAKGTITVAEFLERMPKLQPDELAVEFFGNSQMTSSRGGIRKAEAVRLFCEALSKAGINDFGDATDERLQVAQEKVEGITGQGAGTSFVYFRMLIGDDSEVKPDRMIAQFVSQVTGTEIDPRDAAAVVKKVADRIGATPRSLDFALWNYQRAR